MGSSPPGNAVLHTSSVSALWADQASTASLRGSFTHLAPVTHRVSTPPKSTLTCSLLPHPPRGPDRQAHGSPWNMTLVTSESLHFPEAISSPGILLITLLFLLTGILWEPRFCPIPTSKHDQVTASSFSSFLGVFAWKAPETTVCSPLSSPNLQGCYP